ncbi:MAG: response regulator transcription factor [Pirellulaceae bacterium]|nr:response regulator transcription factor [Pirellulaceae bacterium]
MNRTPQSTTKILIVDDHPMVREGLSMRIELQSDLEVCGVASTQDEAYALVKQNQPDLILVDIILASGNGLELIKQVKSRFPPIKMLVISAFQDSLYAERALRAGALGYLNKQQSSGKVIEAIRTVLRGERFVDPEISRRLIDQALGGAAVTNSPVKQLTDRELEVFRLIGEGTTTGAIAEQLFLSVHTVDRHRENIKRKLCLSNANELTCAAAQWLVENG